MIQESRQASVRDLRNHFAHVAKWIEDGERVIITRNGIVFATLAPARPEKLGKPDWAARFKHRAPIVANHNLTSEETEAFYDEMRGEL